MARTTPTKTEAAPGIPRCRWRMIAPFFLAADHIPARWDRRQGGARSRGRALWDRPSAPREPQRPAEKRGRDEHDQGPAGEAQGHQPPAENVVRGGIRVGSDV